MAAAAAFVGTPKITPMSFVNADGTTKKTIHTAGATGSKVVTVVATSTDTVARTAQVWLTRSAVSYLLGSVVIATLAGTDGATATAGLLPASLLPLPTDNDGQRYLFMVSGDTLQVGMTVAVTAAKEIDVLCIAADF